MCRCLGNRVSDTRVRRVLARTVNSVCRNGCGIWGQWAPFITMRGDGRQSCHMGACVPSCAAIRAQQAKHLARAVLANALLELGTLPHTGPSGYVGCYTDSRVTPLMTIIGTTDDMTNQLCRTLAARAGWAYFGLQKGTSCFGSNSSTAFAKLGTSTNCTKGCAGRLAEGCGGDASNDANDVFVTAGGRCAGCKLFCLSCMHGPTFGPAKAATQGGGCVVVFSGR